ncbi:MAG: putative methyltransferase [Patescibacteria group bacterium]|nr:putative methyltransferase [Patescibacteria group bacterium]
MITRGVDTTTATEAETWAGYAQEYSKLRSLDPYMMHASQVVDMACIEETSRVLIPFCGGGIELDTLQRRGFRPRDVIGLDGSRPMLSLVGSDYGFPVELIQADLNEPHAKWGIRCEPDRFICSNGLYALRDPAAFLGRLAALAAPGAILVVSTPKPDPDPFAVLREHLDGVRLRGGDPDAEKARLLDLFGAVLAWNERLRELYGLGYQPDKDELYRLFDASPWEIQWYSEAYAGQNHAIRAVLQT